MSIVVLFCVDDVLVVVFDELVCVIYCDCFYYLWQVFVQYLERQQWQVVVIDEGLVDVNVGCLLEYIEIEKCWGL